MKTTRRIPTVLLGTLAALVATITACDTVPADDLDRQGIELEESFTPYSELDELEAESSMDDDEQEPAYDSDEPELVPLAEALVDLYSDPSFDERSTDLLVTASADQCYQELDGELVSVHCADAVQAFQEGDDESIFLVERNAANSCESCVDFCRWSLNCVLETSNTRPYNKGMGCKKWWGCDWNGQTNCVSSC